MFYLLVNRTNCVCVPHDEPKLKSVDTADTDRGKKNAFRSVQFPARSSRRTSSSSNSVSDVLGTLYASARHKFATHVCTKAAMYLPHFFFFFNHVIFVLIFRLRV